MKNTSTQIAGCVGSLVAAALLSFLYAFVAQWIYGEVGTAFNLDLPQFSYWFWWATTWLLTAIF